MTPNVTPEGKQRTTAHAERCNGRSAMYWELGTAIRLWAIQSAYIAREVL